jgi:hypothetical protein
MAHLLFGEIVRNAVLPHESRASVTQRMEVGVTALGQMIEDVQTGQINFSSILVYDVSRWGRFQDTCSTSALPATSSNPSFLDTRSHAKVLGCCETAGRPDEGGKGGELTLRHELEIMDVKAAIHAALRTSNTFAIEKFITWPQLFQFKTPHPKHGADFLMKPDGFVRIHEKEAETKGFFHECFLEVDRSHEEQIRLVGKFVSYTEYYKSGGFAVRVLPALC